MGWFARFARSVRSAKATFAMGIVTSLAHPGGNITGSTFFVPESRSKGITTRRSACGASNFCRTTGA
jgi:hypothetical protein